jgi:biopolymer transport protein ExbB/TolQ
MEFVMMMVMMIIIMMMMIMIMMIIIIIIIINTAVPNTHNLAKKTRKQNKYQELTNETCAMWKQNTAQVVPIAISSTRVIPKSLPESLKRLYLHPDTYIQMQKSVILGTCSIVRNFLNYK